MSNKDMFDLDLTKNNESSTENLGTTIWTTADIVIVTTVVVYTLFARCYK